MAFMTVIGLGLLVIRTVAQATRRIDVKTGDGISVIAWAVLSIQSGRVDRPFWALCEAALCCYSAYEWWRGGGGDDTRRWWRKLRGMFSGVRRTAPAAA
jgi:hypothetical protein